MWILLSIVVMLLLLNLTLTTLCLSCLGHTLTAVQALQAQVAALFAETQFQARVCRKQFVDYMDQRVLPTIGWKPPEPTALELALGQLNRGEEVTLDMSGLGRKHG